MDEFVKVFWRIASVFFAVTLIALSAFAIIIAYKYIVADTNYPKSNLGNAVRQQIKHTPEDNNWSAPRPIYHHHANPPCRPYCSGGVVIRIPRPPPRPVIRECETWWRYGSLVRGCRVRRF